MAPGLMDRMAMRILRYVGNMPVFHLALMFTNASYAQFQRHDASCEYILRGR